MNIKAILNWTGVILLAAPIVFGVGAAAQQATRVIILNGSTAVSLSNPLPVTGGGGGGSVTQGTSPWVDNITQWASIALGAPSAFGTTPGAVNVPGVNAAVISSALPTGAATAANQSSEIALLTSINNNVQSAIPTQAPTISIGGVGIVDSAGTNVATVKAASTAPVATDKALVVSLSQNAGLGASATPVRTDPTGTTPQPVTLATAPALVASTADIGNVGGRTNVTPTNCGGTITAGGTAQNAHTAQSTLKGVTIANLDTSEVMWISFTSTAASADTQSYPLAPATATTFAGLSSYTTPLGFGYNTPLSVIAATTGHKFACTRW